jgi:hypothetical protein
MLIMKACRLAGLAIVGVLAAPLLCPANAQTSLPGFKMPSDNIFCMLAPPMAGHPIADLRCDMAEITSRLPPQPASCQFSWGRSFDIEQNGNSGVRLCVSDTTRDERLPALPYGATWTQGGFSCLSTIGGLACANAAGHGFFLSKAEQDLF